MRTTTILFLHVVIGSVLSIFASALWLGDWLFVKSVDWLVRCEKYWQKYLAVAPALSLKVPGFALNTDRCFVRFHRLLMRFCNRQNGNREPHAMRTGFAGSNSGPLLMAS